MLNWVSSDTFAEILTVSVAPMLVLDTFKVEFTMGEVKSMTVIVVILSLKLFAVSLTLTVKFIALPADTFIVIFWEKVADVAPPKEKLNILLKPEIFTIICPKLNPVSSVALAVRLMTSRFSMPVRDLLRVPLITGRIISTTVIIVSFVAKLFLESLARAVKLITVPKDALNVIFWLNFALVPDRLKLNILLKPVSFTIIWPKLS